VLDQQQDQLYSQRQLEVSMSLMLQVMRMMKMIRKLLLMLSRPLMLVSLSFGKLLVTDLYFRRRR